MKDKLRGDIYVKDLSCRSNLALLIQVHIGYAVFMLYVHILNFTYLELMQPGPEHAAVWGDQEDCKL